MRDILKLGFSSVCLLGLGSGLAGSADQTTPASASPEAPSCHPDQATAAPGPSISQVKPVMAAGPYIYPTDQNLTVSEEDLGRGQHRKIALFKNILIDRLYPSMGGPWSRTYLPMAANSQEPYIWITRYRAEVLDSVSGKPAQEFMCHTKLDLLGSDKAPPSLKGVRSQFVISQGQVEAGFPKGFGLRVENHPERKIDVNIMVLNNTAPTIHQNVDFKATIDYVDDASAKKKKLIPLVETAASASCPEPKCQSASYTSGGGHWMVPPGRQEVRTEVPSISPYDTTVHYMLMHLHPYAESMELRDLTTGKSVWKGYAKNDPKEALLLSTDYYSSSAGLSVYKDHRYEIIAVYHNRTHQPVDAMASLWMYLRDKN